MKIKTLCHALALIAALGAGAAHAADGINLRGATVYGMVGSSDAGYSNSGLGLKLGTDFGPGLLGARELGLTAFYAYSGASNDYFDSNCSRWNISSHSLALGPTFTLPLHGTKLAFQARGYGSINFWNVQAGCSQWNQSGTELDLGYGVGAQYQLTPNLALRLDWDSVGWTSSVFTVGLGMKF